MKRTGSLVASSSRLAVCRDALALPLSTSTSRHVVRPCRGISISSRPAYRSRDHGPPQGLLFPAIADEFVGPTEMLADLDDESERYYAQASNADLIDALADHDFDLEVTLHEAAKRMAAFERSLQPALVTFHSRFSEEFVGLDDELQLPPRLQPNETVSAMQVTRLLDKFVNTQHTRSPEENEKVLDEVVALIDRIVIRVGVPIPPPSLPSATTYEDPLLNERYAEHVVHRSNLPYGNTIQNWRQLLEALASVDRVDTALQVFESLETRFKIIPNISLFLTAWRLCKEYGRRDKTLGYMDYFFSCRARSLSSDDWVSSTTFNTILSAVPDFLAALAVVEKMKKEKIALDADTYGQMVHHLVKQGQVNTAVDYMRLMKSQGYYPNLATYISIFNGLLRSPTDPFYATKGHRSKGIQTESDSSASNQFYSLTLMLKFFEELKERHTPTGEVYAMVLRMGDSEKAFAIFEEIKQQRLVHYSHMISLIAVSGASWQSDRALEIFWTMKQRYNVNPSPACLNSLLVALVRSGRFNLIEPTMIRAHDVYNLAAWPKTVSYILTSATHLEDLAFCKSFMELVTTRWPRTMDTRKVRGPVAALEAKLAEVHRNDAAATADASADATKERHELL